MNHDAAHDLVRRQRQQAKRTAFVLALVALGIYVFAFLKYSV